MNNERLLGIKLSVFDGEETAVAAVQVEFLRGKRMQEMLELLLKELEEQIAKREHGKRP